MEFNKWRNFESSLRILNGDLKLDNISKNCKCMELDPCFGSAETMLIRPTGTGSGSVWCAKPACCVTTRTGRLATYNALLPNSICMIFSLPDENFDEMVGSPRPSAERCHYSLMIRQKLQDFSGLHKLTLTRAILTRVKNLRKQDMKMKVVNWRDRIIDWSFWNCSSWANWVL